MSIFPDWLGETGGGGTVTIYAEQFDVELGGHELSVDMDMDDLTIDIGHQPIEIELED